MATMTHQKRSYKRAIFSGVRQQFTISAEAEKALAELANELGKTSPTHVKREILEACKGITARNYYIALGRLQELANK